MTGDARRGVAGSRCLGQVEHERTTTELAPTIDSFAQHYGRRPSVVARAPGRINLIGEHVDYCDGCVLPLAIPQCIVAAAAADNTGEVRAYSEHLGVAATIPVDIARPDASGGWSNYLRGMVCGLRQRGVRIDGAQLWIGGDLPTGSGLSSSAALCVSAGMALAAQTNTTIPPHEIARIAQRAEHDFAGMPCGIMDQLAVCLGRRNHALRIDCRDLSYEYIPFRPTGVTLLAIPSGVKHNLVEGAYGQRVASCRRALEVIAAHYPSACSLRDVTREMLDACQPALDPETHRRARHVVSELSRVAAATTALRNADWPRLGALISDTHRSLRDDYEVSCPEIERIIDLLNTTSGVLGARMVGGGFGGSVLALVRDGAVRALRQLLITEYYAPRHLSDRPICVHAADGASVANVD